MPTTTGTGPGAVTDGHAGWDCPNGASLLAAVTGPGRGTLPAHHGVIYVCPDHQAQAEARITAAGHQPDTDPAPPGHRSDPWPCGHITTYGDNSPQLANALTIPAERHVHPPTKEQASAPQQADEPGPESCQIVHLPSGPVRVAGGGPMDDTGRQHLAEVVAAARRHYLAEHPDTAPAPEEAGK